MSDDQVHLKNMAVRRQACFSYMAICKLWKSSLLKHWIRWPAEEDQYSCLLP